MLEGMAAPDFNVIIPQPFSLSSQSKEDLDKIRDEIMDKEKQWENRMANFFGEHNEFANSWRMIPRNTGTKKPRGLFNSKSGETNRAVNTLSSLWFRMLTAGDPYFEAVAMGLNDQGMELTEEDLYAVEGVLVRQLQVLQFKRKLKKSLGSVALFGTAIVEEPWVSRPIGSGQKSFEGTDFVFRSLLQTGFDPYVFDLDASDYIFTIDFPTKYRLRQLANSDSEVWNKEFIEKAISESENFTSSGTVKFNTDAYNRINQRKERAGYSLPENDVFELLTYHGKLDTSNPVLQNYWESEGRQDDIRFTDWTTGLLSAENVVRLHCTPFGTWKHVFKTAHYNEFELEPIGYGVGKIGKKAQRELDVTQARMNDSLAFALYPMWLVSKYAGLKANQLQIKPWSIIELEDITQMSQLKIDLNTIVQAMGMQGLLKEDFRVTTGAQSNLQAVPVKGGTATEASILQTEGIRGASVIAEIIAETFIREHIETCHINNTELLDNDIYIQITGQPNSKIKAINKYNLPKNIGFSIKTVTDKDARPERIQKILEGIKVFSSVRQMMPTQLSINSLLPMVQEYFRSIGLNPRLLSQPVPFADQLTMALQKNGPMMGQGGGVGNEVAGEAAGEANDATITTPVGDVPTSPLPSQSLIEGL